MNRLSPAQIKETLLKLGFLKDHCENLTEEELSWWQGMCDAQLEALPKEMKLIDIRVATDDALTELGKAYKRGYGLGATDQLAADMLVQDKKHKDEISVLHQQIQDMEEAASIQDKKRAELEVRIKELESKLGEITDRHTRVREI